MPLIVETGAGTPGANAYCSLDEAEAFFEERLHKAAWDNAADEDKEAALIWATRLLDETVLWNGRPASADQPLAWPRHGVVDPKGLEIEEDEIPPFLKRATAEFAMHLIQEDRTLETNRDLKGFRRLEVDVINIVVDTKSTQGKKQLLPPSVWFIIRPYGRLISSSRTLVRI